MCICTSYRIDKLGLYTCVCVYVHITGMTRQRDENCIGWVCVYIFFKLTRQKHEGYIKGCMCICTSYSPDKTKG